MEFVLRHAQNYIPPSQIAVVCQKSGKTYRWVSALCLTALLVTGIGLAAPQGASEVYGKALVGISALWVILVVLLALLAFYVHPEMHIRVSPTMSAEEVQAERQRVKRAIVRMDIIVRMELACAIVAMAVGAMLHAL